MLLGKQSINNFVLSYLIYSGGQLSQHTFSLYPDTKGVTVSLYKTKCMTNVSAYAGYFTLVISPYIEQNMSLHFLCLFVQEQEASTEAL